MKVRGMNRIAGTKPRSSYSPTKPDMAADGAGGPSLLVRLLVQQHFESLHNQTQLLCSAISSAISMHMQGQTQY